MRDVLPKPPLAQAAKPAASLPSAPPRSLSAQSAALGLPPDKLSAVIVSFARFFSLPLKPQTLAAIRRNASSPVLKQPAVMRASSQAIQSDQVKFQAAEKLSVTKTDAKSYLFSKEREALSLAAAAAESKGVELQPKGLQMYAEAVDPRQRRDGGGQKRGNRDKNQNEQDEKAPQKTVPITADSLKQAALDYTEKNHILDILNKLPGKNGQRWIVLPFDFYENGFEFNVSMRILLDDEYASNRAYCMVMDILINNEERERCEKPEREGEKFERRWLFILEAVNEKLRKLSVYFKPEPAQKRLMQFKKELSQLLEIPFECIFIKKSDASFPHEANCEEALTAVDEEF